MKLFRIVDPFTLTRSLPFYWPRSFPLAAGSFRSLKG